MLTAGGIVNATANVFTTLTMAGTGAETVTALTVNGNTTGNLVINDTNTGAGIITALSDTGRTTGSLTINDSSSGALTIATLSDGGTTGAVTINETGSGSVTITSGTSTIATTGVLTLNNTGSGLLKVTALTANTLALETLSGTGNITEVLTDTLAGAVAITGAATGNITLTLNHNSAATQLDTVTLNNGNNTLVIGDTQAANTAAITIGNGLDVITLAANHTGVDNITFSAATGNAGGTGNIATITNLYANNTSDTITFIAGGALLGTANTVTSNNATVYGSFAAGLAAAQSAAGAAATFVYGGNTYVDFHAAAAANNLVVAMVGVHTGTVVSATGVFTLTA